MLTGCNKCHPWQFLIKLHKSRQKVIFLFLVQFGWHTIQLSQTLTFPLEIISLCKFFSQTVCVAQGKWAANGSDPPVLVEKYAWSSQRSHSQWHSYQKKKSRLQKTCHDSSVISAVLFVSCFNGDPNLMNFKRDNVFNWWMEKPMHETQCVWVTQGLKVTMVIRWGEFNFPHTH